MTNTKGIDATVAREIQAQLDGIEVEHDVRILFAIESGSRAWGFPSPDSDYDVRFVYVHTPDWYLTIERRRDVIELPISDNLDINGWDLRKALQLILKANPVLSEWLRSPIVYRADKTAVAELAAFAETIAHGRSSRYHYLSIAVTNYENAIVDRRDVPLKKYLYATRPVLALRWLREFPNRPLPMALSDLRAGLEVDDTVNKELNALLAKKAQTKELGTGPAIPELNAFIAEEICRTREELGTGERPEVNADTRRVADELFRRLVRS
jgi:uncharacterized protein